MRKVAENYLSTVKVNKSMQRKLKAVIPLLSLFVILGTFWWLKLTGITLAGEAFCGIQEHAHSEACAQTLICSQEETAGHTHDETCLTQECPLEETPPHSHTQDCYEVQACALTEHIHVASCYSDLSADLETGEAWEATLADIPADLPVAERIVAVARSQLGYTESVLNFQVDADMIRHGITRYGQWYGNPYGEWANMFTAFCLHYGGLTEVPISAGADTMRLQWIELQRYREATQYTPAVGDVVFLDQNGNAAADITAVITEVTDTAITVIQGDLHEQVAQTVYDRADPAIMGYGLAVPESHILMTSKPALRAESPGATVIAKTTGYDQSLFTENNSFVVYTQSGSDYYAFDGNGNAVQIYIGADGTITADVEDANTLLWSFTYSSTNSYLIKNISTGRYMHAYPNNGSGVTTGGAYPSTLLAQSNGTIKIRSNSEYARLVVASGNFQMTQNQSLAAAYNLGIVSHCTVWLDGTNGGLMSLSGSQDKRYTLNSGDTIQLPEQWQTPAKYGYTLRGWYDVKNSRYYAPGAEVTVTENLVFYADWVASTYDVGQYNSLVSDTVSTNGFITTRVFDYSVLFNALSQSASVTVNASGHSETWSQVTSGTVPYQGGETLDFSFIDYDGGGDISYPNNRGNNNHSGGVYAGLYNETLERLLFGTDNSFDPATGTGVIGKQYLGTADHLFQFMSDPTDAHYGYYYYDSKLNAASYNQTDGRFYVYDYLERTADSEKDGGDGGYSDFLPFNSPYANTNGHDIATYTYDGEKGEYVGVNHLQYDAKYNTNNNSATNVGTNYGFGMSMELSFYLPEAPGSVDADGNYGNQDVYGKDMHFQFSGDDDVWVLLDGQLVLDIGGIHGIESGDINFATGVVTVNGVQTGTLTGFGEGEHILTVYYLERGSSQSNCAIYFNLAPRFSFSIQKEDVLTRDVLNGAQFSVYTDKACTVPAQLWESEAVHESGAPATNTFTVVDGVANLWGLSAGKTYYIRETKPPDAAQYSRPYGTICLSLDKRGVASYSVEIAPEAEGADIANGFTVHGFRIDEETQQAFIVVTNAPDWVEETTAVQVLKHWNDTQDHTYDSVTVYLTVTDPDGTVRRIREISLSEENDWKYTWTNLPKYWEDGVTEIQYGIEEAYKSGYNATVERVETISNVTYQWGEADSFENGQTYLLKTANGCLATTSASATTLQWMNEEAAKTSSLALWTAAVTGSNVRLTNGEGQILSFNYSTSGSNRYFYATTGSATYQNLVATDAGSGFRLSCTRSNRAYYMSALNNSGRMSTSTSSGAALLFTPMTLVETRTEVSVEGVAFRVTNTPLDAETSLTVYKNWDVGSGSTDLYQQAQVTVKLLANGKDTGRTVTLSLKNSWTATFQGLPYTDESGNVIVYTVEESWETEDWIPSYSDVTATDGDPPTYAVTVTNTYRWGRGYELPATGGLGQTVWILSGFAIMLGSLVYGCIMRRKRERRETQ